MYSGGKPEFYEDDIFKLTVPVKKYEKTDTTTDTHQDTHQDAHQDKIYKLVEFCSIPRSRTEMQEFVKLKDKVNFKRNYLAPMLAMGLIKMTIPDKPTSRNQKYVAVNGDKAS